MGKSLISENFRTDAQQASGGQEQQRQEHKFGAEEQAHPGKGRQDSLADAEHHRSQEAHSQTRDAMHPRSLASLRPKLAQIPNAGRDDAQQYANRTKNGKLVCTPFTLAGAVYSQKPRA